MSQSKIMTLPRFLYIAIISVLPLQSFAGTDYVFSSAMDCMARDGTGCDNDIYFCGYTSNKMCEGVGYCGDREKLTYGESINFNGTKYYCCDTGNGYNGLGKFVAGNSYDISETLTIDLPGGGNCTYTRSKTICDSDWTNDKPCTKPECPNSGDIFRNGECVTPCVAPAVFASPTSNVCTEDCETTTFQGKGLDKDFNPTCLHCDSATEIWIKSKKGCVNKIDGMKTYNTADMKKCWRCDSFENFKKCLQNETVHDFCPQYYKKNRNNEQNEQNEIVETYRMFKPTNRNN